MSLSRQQELQLLEKLSSDDGFRSRFEADPGSALGELGVDDATLGKLDPARLKPAPLSSKQDIAASLQKLRDANTTDHVCLVVPVMRNDYGSKD